MITPTRSPAVLNADLNPQAVLSWPIDRFVSRYARFVQDEVDDLDHYRGVYFTLDGNIPFAMKHYDGHPNRTTTLYLDSGVGEVEVITRLIERILREMQVPRSAIFWQRRDNPDL